MKQVIVIRRDLWMRRGKEIAQGAHASLNCVLDKANPEHVAEWLDAGGKKVVCKVKSEMELLELARRATALGLPHYLVRDHGRTEVVAGTPTALGVGPAPESEVDKVTGELELY